MSATRHPAFKRVLKTLCQLFWGATLFLTSLYCLLAFLPYTYVAVVKAPPYAWVLWFVAHYTAIYWASCLAGLIAYYAGGQRSVSFALLFAQAVLGLYLTRLMSALPCDWRAYACGLATLFLLVGISAQDAFAGSKSPSGAGPQANFLLNYSTGAFAAAVVALLAAAVAWHGAGGGQHVSHWAGAQLAMWSLVSHLLVAILVVSLLNLVSLAAFRTRHRRTVKRALIALLVCGGLGFGALRFLENSLSFNGWRADLYAAFLPPRSLWPASPSRRHTSLGILHATPHAQQTPSEAATMGGFFAYLKRRGLYDSSIIILTSDHGDATGELGRSSHSLSIYREVIRVPLIVHLPEKMRNTLVYDDSRISALTDITPTLYYLLGHRPVIANPMFGRPLFTESQANLFGYPREDLFLASDERAVYGILSGNGRYLYATYDSPARSYLYDLANDPLGIHDVLTPALKKEYDERIIEHLQAIGAFYGCKPKLSTLLAGKAK